MEPPPLSRHLLCVIVIWGAGAGAIEVPELNVQELLSNRMICHAGLKGFSVVNQCEVGVVNCRTIKAEQAGEGGPLMATSCGLKEAKSGCEAGPEEGVTHCYCNTLLCNEDTAANEDVKLWAKDLIGEALESFGMTWETIPKDLLPESSGVWLESILGDGETQGNDNREPVTCFSGNSRASMTKTKCKQGIQSCSYKFKADGTNEISAGCFFPGPIAEICAKDALSKDPGKTCVCNGNLCNDPNLIESHRDDGAGPSTDSSALILSLLAPMGTTEVSKDALEKATAEVKGNMPSQMTGNPNGDGENGKDGDKATHEKEGNEGKNDGKDNNDGGKGAKSGVENIGAYYKSITFFALVTSLALNSLMTV